MPSLEPTPATRLAPQLTIAPECRPLTAIEQRRLAWWKMWMAAGYPPAGERAEDICSLMFRDHNANRPYNL